MNGIRVCVFDAYGTLFDYASAAARCKDELGARHERLNALWREKQLQYTWLRSLQGRHADFWQVTGDALNFAMETLGLGASDLRERLMNLYLMLETFPEVPETLRRLRDGAEDGHPIEWLARNAARVSKVRGSNISLMPSFRSKRSASTSRTRRSTNLRLTAWGERAGDFVSVLECVGCLCGVSIRHAGGLV